MGLYRQKGVAAIPLRYDWAGDYSGGLAPVKINNLYGYIDKQGNIVIKPAYDWCGPFIEGLAVVTAGALSGYIDPKGRAAIPPKFQSAADFHAGKARVVIDNRHYVIDTTGRILYPLPYNWVDESAEGLSAVKTLSREQSDSILDEAFNATRTLIDTVIRFADAF